MDRWDLFNYDRKEKKSNERVFLPAGIDEVKEAISALRDGIAVVLDLSNTPDEIGQRVLDLMSGAAYALSAGISVKDGQRYSYTLERNE